jgi:Uma2 family endonuclease
VVSPSNTATDLNQKIDQYLRYGSAAALVVYPRTAEVYLYVSGESPRVFRVDETITVPEVAPGWSIKVSDLF